MASSLAVKRFLSSALLSRSLLRPVASFNTNAMRQYDQHSDDRNVDVDRRAFPRTRRDDLLLSDVFDPFSPTRSLSQVLNMVDLLTDNPVLSAASRRGWDARETEDALLLRLDMPGLGKDDVKISVEQNTLIIKGEESGQESQESGRRFSSRIDLPDKLYKNDEIKAEMKNGVLKVIVPKMKEQERNNVINVKVN
ncbi:unnamed protein product [Vicia faba]|uniref:SHSP domain-containing protein n=1 Tax=Vicia faba TaxID=3906 RepID=A0AAV1ACX6_VICFA|nr:unnamed protein product [Vicia faba]